MVIWTVTNLYQDKKEGKALSAFYGAEKNVEKKRGEILKGTKDKKKNTSDVLAALPQELFELKAVTQKFPKSQAAFLAYLKLGELYSQEKKYTDALSFYEKALPLAHNKFYKILVTYNLGYLYELSQDYPKAIEWYRKITEYKKQRILLWTVGYRPNAFWIASAYFGLGRSYEKLKKVAEAKEMYLHVADEFPNTTFADKGHAFAQLLN